MSPQNLWGDLPAFERVETPVQVIRAQAELLTELTKGDLVGFVTQSKPRLLGRPFAFELCVRAPALGTYRTTLLTISCKAHLYPLTVLSPRGKPRECQNEEELVEALRVILQGEEVRNLIGTLLMRCHAVRGLSIEEAEPGAQEQPESGA